LQVNWRWRTTALAVVGLALLGVWLLGVRDDDGGQSSDALGPVGDARAEVGSPAPDFVLESLDGELVRLSDFRGQVVLINFWASWCGPCRVEIPYFEDRYQTHQGELVVLGVNTEDTLEGAKEFRADVGFTYPTAFDGDGTVEEAYRVRGLPTSVFVDENGVVQAIRSGGITEEQLDELLAGLGIS
jgi:cytochrome c biogenesis protein CcmG/thiol:disulfide interchange protein DsbE